MLTIERRIMCNDNVNFDKIIKVLFFSVMLHINKCVAVEE